LDLTRIRAPIDSSCPCDARRDDRSRDRVRALGTSRGAKVLVVLLDAAERDAEA
jgi:hypothetical protein